jgi:diguanylate cyclase (GGDEF)-like protein
MPRSENQSRLSEPARAVSLVEALQSLGLPVVADAGQAFGVRLAAGDGSTAFLPTEGPPGVAELDPDLVGLALVDPGGLIRAVWGLASAGTRFVVGRPVWDTELAEAISAALKGQSTNRLVDGMRALVCPTQDGAAVLIVDAAEEAALLRTARLIERRAEALERIGKALTMNQTLQPLVMAAVHAIASATEAAAVLLWVRPAEEGAMELVASVGASRAGASALAVIDPERGASCAAELAARQDRPLVIRRVDENPFTADLEAKFCYLKPGGALLGALSVGHRLVGILEVVAREGDELLLESTGLFGTIVEHLALAINSALLFESTERLAHIDPLTGIANHRSLQEYLARRIRESQRTGQPVGLVMLDVDEFRLFNESEGHDTGDAVLRHVAEVLKTDLRPYDMAARYGGDEFTLVLPGTTGDDLRAAAERIRQRIAGHDFVSPGGQNRRVSVSVGFASYPADANDSASLLKAADLGLYEAKEAGRNLAKAGRAQLLTAGRVSVEAAVRAAVGELPKALRGEARSLERRAAPVVAHLATRLALTDHQEATVRRAVALAQSWAAADDAGTEPAWARSTGLEDAVACLRGLSGRMDAEERPPLLSRVLAVVLAVVAESGLPLRVDPSRYDQDVVAALADLGEAA